MELEYEIQRKITSAALRLATDGSPSKAVKRQRKMIYQQSLQQLKVTLHSLRVFIEQVFYYSYFFQPSGYRNETAFVALGRNVQQHASTASSAHHQSVE